MSLPNVAVATGGGGGGTTSSQASSKRFTPQLDPRLRGSLNQLHHDSAKIIASSVRHSPAPPSGLAVLYNLLRP
jgi:hypothetical protein